MLAFFELFFSMTAVKNLVIEKIVDGETKVFVFPEAKDVDAAYERLLRLIK